MGHHSDRSTSEVPWLRVPRALGKARRKGHGVALGRREVSVTERDTCARKGQGDALDAACSVHGLPRAPRREGPGGATVTRSRWPGSRAVCPLAGAPVPQLTRLGRPWPGTASRRGRRPGRPGVGAPPGLGPGLGAVESDSPRLSSVIPRVTPLSACPSVAAAPGTQELGGLVPRRPAGLDQGPRSPLDAAPAPQASAPGGLLLAKLLDSSVCGCLGVRLRAGARGEGVKVASRERPGGWPQGGPEKPAVDGVPPRASQPFAPTSCVA